ncbi:hypothetical protein [Hyphobacterium sp.]|uniref:hypothetical protein n=1 Tax=Hyphobacterium sp. TaxID=2004662 RepID=UPI003B5166CD
MPGWIRIFIAYVAAAIAGGLATTLLSTQVVLLYLAGAGADIPLAARSDAMLADLTGFAPTLILLTAIGYLLALPVAALVSRLVGGLRTIGYVLAGFVTILVMVTAIEVYYQSVLGVGITPIASARAFWGLAVMALGGALGGWVFARLARARSA